MTKIFNRIQVGILAAVLASSAVLTTPQAMAERGGRHGGPKGEQGGEQRLAKMFERADTNSDGVLSLAEMTTKVDEKAQKMLQKKDADEDGVLSLTEFTANKRGEMPDLSDIAAEIVLCVTELAAENPDISVPDTAMFVSPQARFEAIDTSGDGGLDLAELQAAGLAKATARFEHMDSDDDGQVSLEEFTAAHKAHRATKKAIRQCVNELNDNEDL